MGNLPLAEAYNTYKLAKKVKKLQQQDIELRIQSLMNADQSVVNENANKDSRVFNTIRDLTAGVAAKAIGLRMMLPKHVSNAHMKGDIHYHDLDYQPYSPMTNCVLIDFQNMLREGFKIGNAEVDSPRSVNTATAQMAQIFANVASSQYGGCSADRVDEVLAPYARLNYEKHLETAKEWVEGEAKQIAYAEEKTRKDIYDAMQSLEYRNQHTLHFKRTNTIHHARIRLGDGLVCARNPKSRPASTHQRIGQGKTYSNLPEIDLRLEKRHEPRDTRSQL